MANYADKLRNPKWQRKRLEIFQRDKWACTMCGDTKTELHVHHEKYIGDPWEAPNDSLKTLCSLCHATEHAIESIKEIKEHPEIEIIKDQKKIVCELLKNKKLQFSQTQRILINVMQLDSIIKERRSIYGR
jgi:5-methylcytosine-specific restriction endonuclease McrA